MYVQYRKPHQNTAPKSDMKNEDKILANHELAEGAARAWSLLGLRLNLE